MIKLSRQDFQSLSQEDKDLAKRLGISFDLEKITRKSHSRCKRGEPYALVTTIQCRLCNTLHTRTFRMSSRDNFLHSEEIGSIPDDNKLKVKTSFYTARTCTNCHNYLSSMSKEDVVQRFLLFLGETKNFIM